MGAMTARQAWIGAAALVALAGPAFAGPCAGEIDALETQLNAKLDAVAAHGKGAQQSTAAQLHRQPTPDSLAAAEAQAGDISEKDVAEVRRFVAEARKADQGGDLAGCRKALADARALGGL